MSRSSDRYKNDPTYRELQKKRGILNYWRKKPLLSRPSPKVFKTEF